MWYPLSGEPFILSPKHAAAFKVAASALSQRVGSHPDDDDWEGDTTFCKLTQGQKQAAILIVCKALLDPAFECPELTAALGSTVDCVYKQMLDLIEDEVPFQEETEVRQLVLDALDESNYWEESNQGLESGDEPETNPGPSFANIEEWAYLVDSLREEVLDDYDFDMEEDFVDMEPAHAAKLKSDMNIPADYFVTVVEDPTPARLKEIRRELRSVLD